MSGPRSGSSGARGTAASIEGVAAGGAAAVTAERVAERVEEALGRAGTPEATTVTTLAGPCLARPLALARPSDLAELRELLRLAAREGWRVLPIGHGSKLGWSPPPARAELALSLAGLAGIVAYEPGDGTVTALAGTRWDELERAVCAGGHRLSPDVPRPERASAGGVVAAGQSGICRLRRRPVRDHVLGLRVALADGRVVKSGGRLVKNVTGFDMHRLHTGAHGALGVIVELSLRLFPLPAHDAVLSARAPRLEDALEAARRVLATGIQPLAVVVEAGLGDIGFGAEAAAPGLHVLLSGRAEGVERDLSRARDALGALAGESREGEDARELRGRLRDLEPDAERALSLRVTCLPSQLARALELTREWLREHDLPPGVLCHPGIATLDVPLGAPAGLGRDEGRALREAARTLRLRLAPRARLELRGGLLALPEEPPPGPARELGRRIRAALDPEGLMASDRFRNGAR